MSENEYAFNIRDRLSTLEAKHDQAQDTLSRIATAVEGIVITQSRMEHIGAKLDRIEIQTYNDNVRVSVLETRQSAIWGLLTVVSVSVVGALVTMWFT